MLIIRRNLVKQTSTMLRYYNSSQFHNSFLLSRSFASDNPSKQKTNNSVLNLSKQGNTLLRKSKMLNTIQRHFIKESQLKCKHCSNDIKNEYENNVIRIKQQQNSSAVCYCSIKCYELCWNNYQLKQRNDIESEEQNQTKCDICRGLADDKYNSFTGDADAGEDWYYCSKECIEIENKLEWSEKLRQLKTQYEENIKLLLRKNSVLRKIIKQIALLYNDKSENQIEKLKLFINDQENSVVDINKMKAELNNVSEIYQKDVNCFSGDVKISYEQKQQVIDNEQDKTQMSTFERLVERENKYKQVKQKVGLGGTYYCFSGDVDAGENYYYCAKECTEISNELSNQQRQLKTKYDENNKLLSMKNIVLNTIAKITQLYKDKLKNQIENLKLFINDQENSVVDINKMKAELNNVSEIYQKNINKIKKWFPNINYNEIRNESKFNQNKDFN